MTEYLNITYDWVVLDMFQVLINFKSHTVSFLRGPRKRSVYCLLHYHFYGRVFCRWVLRRSPSPSYLAHLSGSSPKKEQSFDWEKQRKDAHKKSHHKSSDSPKNGLNKIGEEIITSTSECYLTTRSTIQGFYFSNFK